MLTLTVEQRMRELEAEFERRRSDLLRDKRDRFVLLADGTVRADFASAGEALAAALAEFQPGEFMIKQVIEPDAEVFRFANPYVGPAK